MSKFDWKSITKADVIKAIQLFDNENPTYPEPRSTFLIYNGKKYPAKHIRGMAYKVHHNMEISKNDYAGGQETVRFFERLGFDVQYTHKSINTHPSKKVLPKKENKSEPITKKLDIKENRITIPTKEVIEQKNYLQLILNKLFDGDVVCEKTFSWMKTPSEIDEYYKQLILDLSNYRGNDTFIKKNVMLRCDFVCESQKLIIEYDERQHFSEARKVSLLSYPDIPLYYDKNKWIKACSDIQAKDNQPKDRDEVRAYYDSTRDIESAKHGYKLVRIMHGQIDFSLSDAQIKLEKMLDNIIKTETKNDLTIENKQPLAHSIKIGLYLQTQEFQNLTNFNSVISLVKQSDIDIFVFPEFGYFPFENYFWETDFFEESDIVNIYKKTLELSEQIGRAVIVNSNDKYGTIMSVYANAFATSNETKCKNYIKHTMTQSSACEMENYSDYAKDAFSPINYKDYKIGMTICYDCNHAIFSRMYGLNDIDIIINSTGGNVVYDKWYKYNKVRAIENKCFTFVTMGGDGTGKNPNCYVYGFSPNGKELTPYILGKNNSQRRNLSGSVYVYDTSSDDGNCEIDSSVLQAASVNKKKHLYIDSEQIDSFIQSGERIKKNLYIVKHNDINIVLPVLDKDEIMKPEIFLKLLYAKELKKYNNKKYIIINKWQYVDKIFYETKLSLVLKVRSMENYCAVIISSNNINQCFQCGMNRTAQVVQKENGKYGLDLNRTGGPETIWRNKEGMKASWRNNIEWLIDTM